MEEALDAIGLREGDDLNEPLPSDDQQDSDDDYELDSELALTRAEADDLRDWLFRTGEAIQFDTPLMDPTARYFHIRETEGGRRVTTVNGVTDAGALSITVRQPRPQMQELGDHVADCEEEAVRAIKSGDVTYTFLLYGERPFEKRLN